MKVQSFFNWSGGKDSALALYYALQEGLYDVQTLLTTINAQNQRISMHGVRDSLLRIQAEAIGIPLYELHLPEQASMSEYEARMKNALQSFQDLGYTHALFGDIFLEDLRKYREQQLATCGMKAVFPLWQKNTKVLLHEFLDLGFKTIVVCVNAALLDPSFAGRVIDRDFIRDLPPTVDPCGENGEFHSFVFDGPIFNRPLAFELGELVFREYKAPTTDATNNCFTSPVKQSNSMGFWFRDLLPVSKLQPAI